MTKNRTRQAITSSDGVNVAGLSPLASAQNIRGVRIYDVGQGDSIAVMGGTAGNERVLLQLDYGGRERNPFTKHADVDQRMPVASGQLLMLTHWDEDHWCSASKGQAAQHGSWLVPRQVTSPRAVRFSATLNDIHCIPETHVGQALEFASAGGDYILWEKIGPFAGAFAKAEDCNKTGVALAIVQKRVSGDEAILLPGDAPFDKVSMFMKLAQRGVLLRGIVAFHHGAGTHWTELTEQLLRNWPKARLLDVMFSCSRPNSYGHPHEAKYKALLPTARFQRTADERAAGNTAFDLYF